jgi:hypothetical protein
VIERWPILAIMTARVRITVIFSGAPVNQSRAGWKFSGSFMGVSENLNPIVRRNLPKNAVFLPTFGQDMPTQLEPRAAP